MGKLLTLNLYVINTYSDEYCSHYIAENKNTKTISLKASSLTFNGILANIQIINPEYVRDHQLS
jgi:hypothetical protein